MAKMTTGKVRFRRLEERQGESAAFLTYSLDENDKFTLWHTEVQSAMRHSGVGGRLVKQPFELAERSGVQLLIVCPSAIDYLARHPTLKDENSAVRSAVFGENTDLPILK